MQNIQNKKKLQIVLLVLIAVLTLGIGYAGITAVNLIINGNATASANQENFKVFFVTSNITTGTGTASIDENDNTIAYFDITGLTKAGDTAVATYTILNDSKGVGAEISLQLTNSNPEYFKITEQVEDNLLQAGEDTTATVTVEMIKTPIESNVTTSVSAKLKSNPTENTSAVGGRTSSIIKPGSFATDSWSTIADNVRSNDTSDYKVGDTKIIEIDNISYTVRLVNKSTPYSCNNANFSQTACGFVVEFADIIEFRRMNEENTSVGGWPASELYNYLQNDFYNTLPDDLKQVIATTKVVSGHSNNGVDSSNFISYDKLYLVAPKELYSGSSSSDTSSSLTRQFDYYVNMPSITIEAWPYRLYTYTFKKHRDSSSSNSDTYWTRSVYSDINSFMIIDYAGTAVGYASNSYGVAPAFRIG